MKTLETKKLLEEALKKDQKAISKGNLKETKLIFKKNTELLKSIIKTKGWPSSKDEKSFHHAWLIAQHSDHDPFFQLQCLGLILPGIKKDKEILIDYAFLLDRVLINLKQKQIFGTQLWGKLEKPDTFSPEQLDSLRDKIGLEPFSKYLKRMKSYSKER